jgi:lipoyl(octanoyl) transferase
MGGDVHEYVRGLERVMIGALAEHGVGAQTIAGLTGVWTDGPAPVPGLAGAAEKIGSIGVHVSKGITTHGLAVNVDNDLQPFEWVIPCGIQGVAMTSIAKEGGREATVPAFAATVGRHFAEVFERAPRAVSLAEALDAEPAAVGPEARPARLGAER